MCRAERCGCNLSWQKLLVCPLCLLRVVAEESDRGIVLVEDGDAPFQFRDHRIVPMKAHLAWAPQMQSDCAHELSVEVKMTKPAVLSVAYQQQRLVVKRLDSQPMVAVEQALRIILPGIACPVCTVLVEPEDP